MELRVKRIGTGEIVTLGLEEYVAGVVGPEIGATVHDEALKAQAVAARTYAVTNLKHRVNGYEVCDTTHCQVYRSDRYSKVTQAVQDTAGEIITYQGKPIHSLFFAECHGHTKNSEDVWSQSAAPYLRSVECPFKSERPRGHGVGLCQMGARLMAEQGYAYQDILLHYYTSVSIERKSTMGYKIPDDVEWIGSPHKELGRKGHRPIAIVDHIAEGTLAGCDSWFNSPQAQVSAHFCVGKNGAIHQYVSTEDTAWANGKFNHPNLSIDWIANAYRNGINPNNLTISIEHEGYTGQAMPEEQYQASLALHRYLIQKWKIEADREHIIGHNQIDSRNRAFCPGRAFPWDRLFQDLAPQEESATVAIPEEPKAEILALMNIQWGWVNQIEEAGLPDIAQAIREHIIAIKNLLGEP